MKTAEQTLSPEALKRIKMSHVNCTKGESATKSSCSRLRHSCAAPSKKGTGRRRLPMCPGYVR